MTRNEIIRALHKLNAVLAKKGINGDIGLYGGAVMSLVYNSRDTTKDVDGIYLPKREMTQAITDVANSMNLEPDWFNDAVKGFISENNDLELFESLSNLNIYVASADYMFAMKCVSCRLDDVNELDDIKFLANYLGISNVTDAIEVIERFYPPNQILPKTQYMLEEIFDEGIVTL